MDLITVRRPHRYTLGDDDSAAIAGSPSVRAKSSQLSRHRRYRLWSLPCSEQSHELRKSVSARSQMTIAPRVPPVPSESLDELLARVGTSNDGLSSAEAHRRLLASGPNEFSSTAGSKVFALIRDAFNPLIIILLAACAASAALGQTVDAAIIAGIIALGTGVNTWQTSRSERAVKRLRAQIAPTATIRRDHQWLELRRAEIVVGDVVRLSAGDLVPADARLIASTDLHVQQASLTGESLPTEKSAKAGVPTATGPDAPELLFLGTSVVSGVATAVVFATGKATAFGDVVDRLSARPEETEFDRGMRRFGMLILETVIVLVLLILAINVFLGRDFMQSLLFSVALAVGLTPEFLPMITTVTLAQGAVRMARDHVIVKHLSAIQNLGSIDVLCCDKTGTLTAGEMSLDRTLDPFGDAGGRALFFAHLNSAFESGIKSPLDAAILHYCDSPKEAQGDTPQFSGCDDVSGYAKTDEIPFDFERRRLSVVLQRDDAHLLITKGAPENIFDICTNVEVAGETRPYDIATHDRCVATFHELSARGFRVLAVSYRNVTHGTGFGSIDEFGMTFVGFLTFADHILEGVADSIGSLRRDGVRVKIVTGDNELVTRFVCQQAGVDATSLMLGDQVERLSERELVPVVERTDVFARISPGQKHRIIGALKAGGHVVGFMGDGINDAPSLHAADVGISVAGAVDVAREAADIVLLERRLDVLHAGILAGRRSFANVLKYLLMGSSANFGNMFSMLGAALFLPFLPMLPTQILLNNFLYDFAQITIPTDNVDMSRMRHPQRWNIGLIRRFMVIMGPISSLYDFLTFFALLHWFNFGAAAFHTGWFIESLATQTLVLFVIRTAGRPWSNRPSLPLTITTVAVVIAGMVLPYTSVAHSLGLIPLPVSYYLFVAAEVVTYLVLVEFVKHRVMQRLVDHAEVESERASAVGTSNADANAG